ncbi:cytochrome c oxidase accessory protein CcoG [Marinigracilibium pacificum]|uniref:Cytochrome c oxidase accessory protein CcoG n=1 Tax=Marinigracilibium pacificum TaxID=2729599 RepID=A0A848J6V0_9BACT|nr:cytochrome c oxidase accessory protein CcoG [Marinigracilibium pacificum]NMM50240.1 cytochrome c oxidase accessory protein CcoG [Marinigracilibium pacificum]
MSGGKSNLQEDLYSYDEEFRDSISTVDSEGKRVWVYPKKPKGNYYYLRNVVSIFLLILFFATPFIKINGNPFLLMNFFERKFYVLGQAFWPQDFFLLALILIIFFVSVILFTTAFGRLWCGWACPQTIFMEMVFRKIEYWIDGDANQQRKLAKESWTSKKIFKRGLKYTIFLIISIIIGHTAMAYLVGIETVKDLVTSPPTENWSGFLGLVFFTGIFFWVFSYFREQACTVVCPYGRLQGVLLDKDSIVVAYDWVRGEPRGKLRKGEVQSDKGDCIDCKLCVHVCPTGIDIRNGTQLECVNCTACIDACDDVMTKIGKPKGLIRYASYNSIKDGIKKLVTTRRVAYSGVLVVLMTLFGFLLFTRSDISLTIQKKPGFTYQKEESTGLYINLYDVQLTNKTEKEQNIHLKVIDNQAAILTVGSSNSLTLKASERFEGSLLLKFANEDLESTKTTVKIGIYDSNDKLIDRQKINFLGPIKY